MTSFAIIPAAGESRRMGQPKLLLPLGDKTLIEHVLAAWQAGGVTHRVVVARGGDVALQEVCHRAGALVVVPPAPPPEMKDSVAAALAYIARELSPTAADAWLLAPADMPGLSPVAVRRLLEAHNGAAPEILVATFAGRRGHPVLFPWPLAAEVPLLKANEGVNALLERHALREVHIDGEAPADVNTPVDYAALRQSSEEGNSGR